MPVRVRLRVPINSRNICAKFRSSGDRPVTVNRSCSTMKKKNNSRRNAVGGNARRPPGSLQPEEAKRYLIWLLRGLFAGVFWLLGYYADHFGPPWPVSPEIHPVLQTTDRPLTFPFIIENGSLLFPIVIHQIQCIHISMSGPRAAGGNNSSITTYKDQRIAVLSSRPYACKIVDLSPNMIDTLSMTITIKYSNGLPGWSERKSDVHRFDWHNGVWSEGAPL